MSMLPHACYTTREYCIHGKELVYICEQCEADRRERSIKAGTLHKPEKRKGWINLYKSSFRDHAAAASHVYADRRHADEQKNKLGERIACIEIEWDA